MTDLFRRLSLLVLGFACLWGSATSFAQYPNKPVRLISPFPPGGGVDGTARIIAQALSDAFGQQVIVDNRAGAGGRIGTELAAKSVPDGYVLLLGSIGPNAIIPAAHRDLPYSPADFAPISLVGHEFTQWYGVLAPAGVGKEVVARLHQEIAKAVKNPKVSEQIVHVGAEAVSNTPAEFAAFIKSEIDRWGKVLRASNIPLE